MFISLAVHPNLINRTCRLTACCHRMSNWSPQINTASPIDVLIHWTILLLPIHGTLPSCLGVVIVRLESILFHNWPLRLWVPHHANYDHIPLVVKGHSSSNGWATKPIYQFPNWFISPCQLTCQTNFYHVFLCSSTIESSKTGIQRAREKNLLEELVQIVDKRDELVRHLDNQEKA